MAVLKGGGRASRPPALRGAFYIRTNRGRLVACKWPRKRGEQHAAKQRERWNKFAIIQRTWKFLTAEEQEAWRQAAKGTPLLPRDAYTACQYGRLWYWTHPDGTKVYPMAAALDVSASLDVLEQRTGSLLVRGPSMWWGLPPGPAGYVLTSAGPNGIPEWQPPPGGGGGTALPSSTPSDYPTRHNPDLLTLTSAAEGGLSLVADPPASGRAFVAALRTLPAGDYHFRAKVAVALQDYSGMSAGVLLRNSGTGEWVRFHLRGGNGVTYLSADRYDASDAFVSTIRREYLAHAGPVTLHIIRQSGTVTLAYGSTWNDAATFTSFTDTDNGGPFDECGLGALMYYSVSMPTTMHVLADELA